LDIKNIKQSIKKLKEFDEIMREEIEAGNPFSVYSSFQSYKSKKRKIPTEKRENKLTLREIPK
jgi:hypothetical protein